jgi:polysaccharide export outer membrane protein
MVAMVIQPGEAQTPENGTESELFEEFVLPTQTPDILVMPDSLEVRRSETLTVGDQTLLKPGDRIIVTVPGFPELSGPQTILADGSIQLQMAGQIRLWGLTPAQASEQIAAALRPYIRYPQVGIALVGLRPGRVLIAGEVRQPGIHQLVQPDVPGDNATDVNIEGYQTLSYALELAGGLRPNADLRNITVRRFHTDTDSRPGLSNASREEIKINLWQALQEGDLSADIRIYDNDEIIVPTAPTINPGEQQVFLDSTFAPESVLVQVGGDVRNPGNVLVRPNDGLNAAIAAAGGLADGASNNVYLLRLSPEGTLIREEYRFGEEDSGPLLDGDIIIAERSLGRRTLEFFGRLAAPVGILRILLD